MSSEAPYSPHIQELRLFILKAMQQLIRLSPKMVMSVIIIGGGPAGCATALSFLKNSKHASCLIIDDTNSSSFRIGESLPPESGQLLHYLHHSLPKQLASQVKCGIHTTCSGNASAWSSLNLEEQHAILNPFGHGLHLNRVEFEEILRDTVLKCALGSSSRLAFRKASFKSLQKNSQGLWAIEIEEGGQRKPILAKWMVDGTGCKASVASKIGIKSITSALLLVFYAIFIGSELDRNAGTGDNNRQMLIEAMADGWWYTSLILHNPPTRIIVFHTLPSHSSAKSSHHAAEGYPCCTAAGSSHLEKTCDGEERWVAVGDAAIAFDPLSSQGMMTALEMGIYVGLKLAQHVEGGVMDRDFDKDMSEAFTGVRKEYEKHRAYYYSIIKHFLGEMFWEKVVGT
ncbi:hypothetical protein CPB84DRAFT_1936840 [Gymnopilus junonius]|uniref:FAD/NAD(P)-binding domain-containing protein n=1 Tax=Gymnopilus junonius TaxID=109634 RepID=A0A9P5NYR5_GYMJU|nr:hypothetical protein CPB84DRAFT_1936840 [Gymnopilus junonius]